jgi:hypothetical protein
VLLKHRSDDIYALSGLKAFVGFVEVRTKAPVPSWWAAHVIRADLFPGRHHAFIPRRLAEGPGLGPARGPRR